jgi:hypothetical protein
MGNINYNNEKMDSVGYPPILASGILYLKVLRYRELAAGENKNASDLRGGIIPVVLTLEKVIQLGC